MERRHPTRPLRRALKALAERVLNAEMDHHLAGEEPSNRRNGYCKKTVITDTGQIELEGRATARRGLIRS